MSDLQEEQSLPVVLKLINFMKKTYQTSSTAAGRRQWLIDGWMIRNKIQADLHRNLLKARYSSEATSIIYAETFELPEYGHQPTPEELERLLPRWEHFSTGLSTIDQSWSFF